MSVRKKLESLGSQYNNSLLNCMHASFLVASELLIPENRNIFLCTFQYSNNKSHVVAAKNKLYFDLWVGAVITLNYKIEYKLSFFNNMRFNKFYADNKPNNIRLINIEYLNG